MQINLRKAVCLLSTIICSLAAFAQNGRQQLLLQSDVDKALTQMRNNSQIDADSVYRLASNWSRYPELKQTGYDYTYYYTDASFGKMPLHVYIPGSY